MQSIIAIKDIRHAIQTRSKKLIRELDGFSDAIGRVDEDDAWAVVLDAVELAAALPSSQPKHGHIVRAVNRAWLAYCDRSDAAARRLYDAIVTRLEATDWTEPQSAQRSYQLLYTFHENHYRFPGANVHLSNALRAHSFRVLALARRLVPLAARHLFSAPVKLHTGVGADAIEMLLETHFYHADSLDDEALRAAAADVVLPLVGANPTAGSGLLKVLVGCHPERATIVCRLIALYLAAGVDGNRGGLFFDIMYAMLENDGGSFIYDDLEKITAEIRPIAKGWTDAQFDTFVQFAFFYRLETDDDRLLLLRKSARARNFAAMLVGLGCPGKHVARLAEVCGALARTPPPSRRAPALQQNRFEDINLKLMVIDQLMYGRGKLPKFDLREFVRQHVEREIMIDKEGYDIIPEVLAHFDALPLPPELLAQVEELGFDGGCEIYHQVYPYWDGESDVFDPRSIADLRLLPNLKRLSSMPAHFVTLCRAEAGAKHIDVA